MPYDIPDYFTVDFDDSFKFKADQTKKRLSDKALVDMGCTGARKQHNIMDYTEGREVTGQRLSKLALQEAGGDIRNTSPREFDHTTFENSFDAVRMHPTVLGSGKQVSNHMRFFNRTCDQVFLDGIVGTNYTGNRGADQKEVALELPVDFVNSGTGTPSGLTLDKVLHVKRIFEETEVVGQDVENDGEIYCAFNASMHEHMIRNIEALTNRDYGDLTALGTPEFKKWHGINWIRTEMVPVTDDPDIKKAVFWVNNKVALDGWMEFKRLVSIRNDLQGHPAQFYSQFALDACRLQDNAVIPVSCRVDL